MSSRREILINTLVQAKLLEQQMVKKKVMYSVKIQRWYRFKKLVKEVQHMTHMLSNLGKYTKPISSNQLNMFDPTNNTINERRYGELVGLLMLKDNIISFNKILVRFYRYVGLNFNISLPIDSTRLLSGWMIVSFPESTIGKTTEQINKTPTEYPCDIYFLAKDMIMNFDKLLIVDTLHGVERTECIRTFVKTLNKYSNGILYFFDTDKREKIKQLLNEYFNIKKNIDYVTSDGNSTEETKKIKDKDRPAILAELQKSLDKIFLILLKFDKTIKKEEIDTYYKLAETREAELEEIQKHILMRDIRTKKLMFLPVIIVKIKNTFCVLKGNKIPLQDSISFDDIFDTDMISRLIFTESFSKEKATSYGSQMKFLINNLESPASSQLTNTEWNLIVAGNHEDVAEYFVTILFFIASKLRNICENIDAMEIMTNANINPFNI